MSDTRSWSWPTETKILSQFMVKQNSKTKCLYTEFVPDAKMTLMQEVYASCLECEWSYLVLLCC